MKRNWAAIDCLVLILLVLVLAGCTAAATPIPIPTLPPAATPTQTPLPQPTPTPGNGKIDMGMIDSQALAGNLLGDRSKRSFFVYLPPDYNMTTKRYPVVYVLHGYSVGPDAYSSPIKRAEDQLSVLGPDNGLIAVFPDCTNSLGGCQYLSSPTIGDYETYIVSELVSQVDQTYRTLADRESRGVAGCSMGGDGAAHFALKYPQVFGAFASMAGTYDWAHDPNWERGREGFTVEPKTWDDLKRQGVTPAKVDLVYSRAFLGVAAAAAPNADKPPFYFDMPFEIVDGQPQIVPIVAEKINGLDPLHDLTAYLAQPVRLRGVMIYQSAEDTRKGVDMSRSFDRTLTSLGVEHTYLEVPIGDHCLLDWTPVLQFMLDHLAH